MGGLEGWDYALSAAEEVEAFEGLRVGDLAVFGAAGVLEVAVLRADPGASGGEGGGSVKWICELLWSPAKLEYQISSDSE